MSNFDENALRKELEEQFLKSPVVKDYLDKALDRARSEFEKRERERANELFPEVQRKQKVPAIKPISRLELSPNGNYQGSIKINGPSNSKSIVVEARASHKLTKQLGRNVSKTYLISLTDYAINPESYQGVWMLAQELLRVIKGSFVWQNQVNTMLLNEAQSINDK